jgi:hypothetical protein
VKDRLSGRKVGSAYFHRNADPLIFGAKMVPYLWRADPSFWNSVTESGNRAKCSNILQDNIDKNADTEELCPPGYNPTIGASTAPPPPVSNRWLTTSLSIRIPWARPSTENISRTGRQPTHFAFKLGELSVTLGSRFGNNTKHHHSIHLMPISWNNLDQLQVFALTKHSLLLIKEIMEPSLQLHLLLYP